ncbi:D-sedoheptulose-7-phosphate isomerase [Thermosulfuriphilus sp.]
MKSALLLKERAQKALEASIAAKASLIEGALGPTETFCRWCLEAFPRGGKLLVFGNGGSAADAQHLAAELVNRFGFDRAPLPAIALTTDTSVLSSISNDYHFSRVFSRQVEALGRPGDIALGISTSGQSENVYLGLLTARQRGLKTAALTGPGGGKLAEVAEITIPVGLGRTPRIQEAHIFWIHLICEVIEETLFGRTKD